MLELSAIIVFGIFAQWIAWKMRIPAIFPLILLGLILGPLSILFMDDQWISPEKIFAGKTMYYFVSDSNIMYRTSILMTLTDACPTGGMLVSTVGGEDGGASRGRHA